MRTNEFGQAIGDALPDFTPGGLPAIKERFEAWLDPTNFEANGQQKQSLREIAQK